MFLFVIWRHPVAAGGNYHHHHHHHPNRFPSVLKNQKPNWSKMLSVNMWSDVTVQFKRSSVAFISTFSRIPVTSVTNCTRQQACVYVRLRARARLMWTWHRSQNLEMIQPDHRCFSCLYPCMHVCVCVCLMQSQHGFSSTVLWFWGHFPWVFSLRNRTHVHHFLFFCLSSFHPISFDRRFFLPEPTAVSFITCTCEPPFFSPATQTSASLSFPGF